MQMAFQQEHSKKSLVNFGKAQRGPCSVLHSIRNNFKQQAVNKNSRALLKCKLGLLVSSYTPQHLHSGRSKQKHMCSA